VVYRFSIDLPPVKKVNFLRNFLKKENFLATDAAKNF